MCTKTKTSYGCGHKFKAEESCGDPSCRQVDKFHFQKDIDCQSCRSAGDTVTRGRDGQGRYGQKHHRPEARNTTPPPQTATAASRQHRPDRIDISGGASPWSPEDTRSQPWNSPIRKHADNAWLDEHDSRIANLQDLFEKHSISSKSSRNASPNISNERLGLRGDEQFFPHTLKYAKTMPLPYEYQNVDYDSDPYSHRRSHRSRKVSQPSDDSMPEYFESPASRYHKTDYPASSSDRGQHGRRRHRNHGTKTEPYSSRAPSHMYESPVSGSPVDGGYYSDRFEVSLPPQYGYTYSRGHR